MIEWMLCVQAEPVWKSTWPFGPGYAEGFLSTVLKFLFIGAAFALICLFLRFAFGPGGRFREKHWDEPGGLDDDPSPKNRDQDK